MTLLDKVRIGDVTIHPEVLRWYPDFQNQAALNDCLTDVIPINIQNVHDWLTKEWSSFCEKPSSFLKVMGLRLSFTSSWFEWKKEGARRAVWAYDFGDRWELCLIEEDSGKAHVTYTWVCTFEPNGEHYSIGLYEGSDSNDDLLLVNAFTRPVLLAQSLMLCRNIVIKGEPKPKRVAKKFRNKHGIPPITYRTIVIQPMQEVMRRAGGVKDLGVERALHIVRGHYREYTEEQPLFGRVSGRFFVSQHLRGSATAGSVIKKYEVKAPELSQVATEAIGDNAGVAADQDGS